MEKEKQKKNIVLYFFKMLLIFIVVDLFISLLPSFISSNVLYYKYGFELLTELFYGFFALIVMLLFHNSYVFTNKHTDFKKSIKFGVPMLAFALVQLFLSLISLDGLVIGNFINVVIFCIFIGFAEEFLCRGWLQNEFLERFGESKSGVIKSILCASIVFGCMHLINVLTTSQGLFFTLFQVINAVCLGFYLGMIYYKTKNIWSVIFLHAFYDFALFLGEVNMVKDCTVGALSNEVVIANCISLTMLCIFWIVSSIYVIKKCNFPDVKASKKKENRAYLWTAIIAFGLLSLIPYEMFAEGYEESYVCYEYSITEMPENYTLHFPYFEEYNIEHERETKTLIMDDEDSYEVKEVIVLNKYNINLSLDMFGTLHIKNLNTGYEREFENGITSFEVIENNDTFTILISKDSLETTIYYSDYIIKNNMTNDDEFIDGIVDSFISYELPLINEIGYVTLEGSDYKYPIFYSTNYDYFIIKSGELFLMQ